MRLRALIALAALPLAAGLAGCSRLPGEVAAEGTAQRPDQVTDFHALYAANCQACHGANGQNGPAIDLANPEYQRLVDDATLRSVISNGMPGTEMPAFAQSAGGMLTGQQVDVLVSGMRKEWARTDVWGGRPHPPYAQPANEEGNAQKGQQVYEARCENCHQTPARQQLTNPVYLSLVSDQALRTIIIAGRPDIGQPDWLMLGGRRPGEKPGVAAQLMPTPRPLSPQDVTDIVTYLHTLRNPAAVSAGPTTPARQSGDSRGRTKR